MDKCEVKFRTEHLHQSVPFIGKGSQTPETGIKDGFKEVRQELPFGIPCIPTGKTGLPFQTFSYSRKFSTGTTRNGRMVKYLKDAGKRRVGSVCLGGMGF